MAISFKKYGWERSPQEDFSDDGNRFLMYRNPNMPEMRLTKLNANRDCDGFYIDFYFDKNRTLSYDEMNNLKCYDYLGKLNCGCNPTQEEVNDVCEHVIVCYADYEEKCRNAKPVDPALIEAKWNELHNSRVYIYDTAYKLVKDNFDKLIHLREYDRHCVLDYLAGIEGYTKCESLESTLDRLSKDRRSAVSYLTYHPADIDKEWYYQKIKEYLA